jgi:hypothetical protein
MVARRREDSAPIRSIRVGIDHARVQSFEAGRVCDAPGCSTVLSVYNASPLCWQHEGRHRSLVGPAGRRRAVFQMEEVAEGVWARSDAV